MPFLKDARLRDPAEIVVDGRGPACCSHVEADRLGQPVAMSDGIGTAMPRLLHHIDRERGATGEQQLAAVAV